MGRGLFLGGQPRPPSQGGVALADANYAVLLYAYMIRPRTTKFDVVRGVGRQPCHCICTDPQMRRAICQR